MRAVRLVQGSVDGSSNDKEIYDEHLVEVEGETELALVPRRELKLRLKVSYFCPPVDQLCA